LEGTGKDFIYILLFRYLMDPEWKGGQAGTREMCCLTSDEEKVDYRLGEFMSNGLGY